MNRCWMRSVVLCAATLLSTSTAWCFDKDMTRKIVTVSPQGSPALTVDDLRKAASFLSANASPANVWTWRFLPGNYVINASILVPNRGVLKGVNIVSDPAAPARIVRHPVWDTAHSPQPLLILRFCRNISLSGFEFHGKTVDFPETPVWSVQGEDQGVEFSSCDTVSVNGNKFFNIGNAALRVATDQEDPVQGVNSFRTTVTNNLFDNIYQISTTTTDKLHGGSAHYRLANNVFRRLHGSIKFATRTEGATNVAIVNNVVESSTHFGLEIVNYQQMEIRGNVLQNIAENAITMYTDGNGEAMTKGFPWGDNFTIAGNVIRNAGGAIRYSHKPFWDGTQNVPKNLVITDNALDAISGIDPATIYVGGIRVAGLNISNNRFIGTGSTRDIQFPTDSTGITQTGNASLNARPVRDLDGNLKSQVVWQQPSNAQLVQWPAPSVWSPSQLTIPAGWTVVAMADIDADRRVDAILNNALTGQIAVLTTGRPGSAQPLAKLDSTWQLAAVGDLNGDGRADLVWRHANDSVTVAWYMGQDASGVTSFTRSTFQMDAAWQLIGASDFDGDGKADLLWRQPNTANTALWLMDGTLIKSKPALSLDATAYLVGIGDFDGDGKSEILMRNPLTGLLGIVYGAAGAQIRVDTLSGPDPQTWRTGTVGDFNGDGCSDIVWRNASSGQISVWLMRGSAMLSATPVSGIDSTWALIR